LKQSNASFEALSPRALSRPAELADAFARIRAQSVRLAAPLSPEDCCVQSMPDASPTKWHLAHTSWFFETFALDRAVPGYPIFDSQFRVLFNSYYNAVGDQHPRPHRGLLTRPSLDEVLAYRAHVDRHVAALLASGDTGAVLETIELGLHHEQQHQELLLTDAKHLLAANPLRPAYRSDLARSPSRDVAPLRWHRFATAIREIGAVGTRFHFDNEAPRHPELVHGFEIASRPVTNGEFLAFVEAGAYAQPEWWLSDGLGALRSEGWRLPGYWERIDGAMFEFTLGGLRPLDLAAPVSHLSFYEADAFARWSGARLPSEAEWEVAAAGAAIAGNFVESDALHPMPLASDAEGAPSQLFGDVWEWTSSAYLAYPGFRTAPGAIGEYNGKFMCNQFVLRGGSCATPRDHVRASYRNFFPPAARWQWSGLRLARDAR
jgi:ergothioneine biosynthesis protein EgtB